MKVGIGVNRVTIASEAIMVETGEGEGNVEMGVVLCCNVRGSNLDSGDVGVVIGEVVILEWRRENCLVQELL